MEVVYCFFIIGSFIYCQFPRWRRGVSKEEKLIIDDEVGEHQISIIQIIQFFTIISLISIIFNTIAGLFNIMIGDSFYQIFQNKFEDEYETEQNYHLFRFCLRQFFFSILTTRFIFGHHLIRYYKD